MRSLKNTSGPVVPGGYRFHEPDRERQFLEMGKLVEFVAEYRQARDKQPVDRTSLRAEIEDWICNEIGSAWYYCLQDGKAMPPPDHTGADYVGTGYRGAEKWRELHKWCLHNGENKLMRATWLENFTSSLPCGTCRRDWRAQVKGSPAPIEGTNDDLFAWSVQQHNSVSQKLGYDTMTVEEARPLYA